jgi:hypothetical protein
MHLVMAFVATAIGGIGIGYACRAWIAKSETKAVSASESELTNWRKRLASALTADEAKVKLEVSNIVHELEAKLKI